MSKTQNEVGEVARPVKNATTDFTDDTEGKLQTGAWGVDSSEVPPQTVFPASLSIVH